MSDVDEVEELPEPELTQHADSIGISTSVFFCCFFFPQSFWDHSDIVCFYKKKLGLNLNTDMEIRYKISTLVRSFLLCLVVIFVHHRRQF